MLKPILIAAALALAAAPASAEVVERSADHFVLRYEVNVVAAPDDFPNALEHIGDWWNPAHTYSGDSHNLNLALDPGTCFCEALPNGTTFEHGAVYEYDPETGVVIDAALGPLRGKTTLSNWSIGWSGQTLVMSYVVRGAGVGEWADPVDAVMGDQFSRLARYLQYGPEDPAA